MYVALGFDAFRAKIIAAHPCTFEIVKTPYVDVLFPPPLNPFEPKKPIPREITEEERNHLPLVTLKVTFPLKIVLSTEFYADGEVFEQPDNHTCDWIARATVRDGALMQRRISELGVMYDTRQAYIKAETGEKRIIFKWVYYPRKSPQARHVCIMHFTTPEVADKLNAVRPRLFRWKHKKSADQEEEEDLEKAAYEAGLDLETMSEEQKEDLKKFRKEMKAKQLEAKKARKAARAAKRQLKAEKKAEKAARQAAKKGGVNYPSGCPSGDEPVVIRNDNPSSLPRRKATPDEPVNADDCDDF